MRQHFDFIFSWLFRYTHPFGRRFDVCIRMCQLDLVLLACSLSMTYVFCWVNALTNLEVNMAYA
jgi:hypothetical protein